MEDGQIWGVILQTCSYAACRISLQIPVMPKVLKRGLVTDGTRTLWRDMEALFFDSYSVFSNNKRHFVHFNFA